MPGAFSSSRPPLRNVLLTFSSLLILKKADMALDLTSFLTSPILTQLYILFVIFFLRKETLNQDDH